MIRGHCEGAMFATKGALAPQRSTEGLCHEAVRSRIKLIRLQSKFESTFSTNREGLRRNLNKRQ